MRSSRSSRCRGEPRAIDLGFTDLLQLAPSAPRVVIVATDDSFLGTFAPYAESDQPAAEECVINGCTRAFAEIRFYATLCRLKIPIFGVPSLAAYMTRLRSLLVGQGYIRPAGQ